ncbi:MAG: hypothetical protein WB609_01655 [Candidatus Cybelea sp.]
MTELRKAFRDEIISDVGESPASSVPAALDVAASGLRMPRDEVESRLYQPCFAPAPRCHPERSRVAAESKG